MIPCRGYARQVKAIHADLQGLYFLMWGCQLSFIEVYYVKYKGFNICAFTCIVLFINININPHCIWLDGQPHLILLIHLFMYGYCEQSQFDISKSYDWTWLICVYNQLYQIERFTCYERVHQQELVSINWRAIFDLGFQNL